MTEIESFRENMLYVADQMYYATEYLEAIKKYYPNTAEKLEKKSGYDLDDLIADLEGIKNDFNYYAYNCEVDEED